MDVVFVSQALADVAPLAGSVDRNITKRMGVRAGKSRSPRGERG